MTDMLVAAARTLAAHIWSATFQATILMIVVMLVSAACRRMSPAFRCWLYCIVLLRLCIPVEVILPVRASVLPDALTKFMSAGVTEQISSQANGILGAIVDKPAAMTDLLALAWLAGAIACGLLIVLRAKRSAAVTASCRPIVRPELANLLDRLRNAYGIRRDVELRILHDNCAHGPVTHGLLKPRILLPASMAESWDAERLEPVILHELAHIRRFDVVINWIQIILQAVYFFHPLVWFVNHRIRQLREEACDDEAVKAIGRPEHYCRVLLNVIEDCPSQPAIRGGVLALLAKPSFTRQRIMRLLAFDSKRRPTGMNALSTGLLVMLSCLCLVVASVKAQTTSTAKVCAAEQCCKPCPDPCVPCPPPCCPPAGKCDPKAQCKPDCCPKPCPPPAAKRQC